jgi:hypothetical protein
MATDESGNAISFASRLFGESHGFWAKPLVDPLEDLAAGTGLLWAIDLYERALTMRDCQGFDQEHHEWLREARDLARNGGGSAEYCEEKSLQVWYHDPTLNLFERGISRLFTALRVLAENNVQEYKRQVISSVVMLGDKGDEGFDSAVLDTAVTEFRRVLSSSQRNT